MTSWTSDCCVDVVAWT